jgi:DNA polymerase III sliding clamp (beta) subunit (PCNA family)
MKIDAQHFRSLIEGPVALSSRRSALQELSYVRLSATGGAITAEGGSFDAHQHSFGECVGDLEPLCVVGTKLRDALGGFSGDIEITLNDGRLRLNGTHSIVLSTVDATKFSGAPNVNGTSIDVDAPELSAAIKAVSWCASADKTRENIQGVNISGNEVVATDGKKVAVADIKADFGTPGIFIHNQAVMLACHALSLDGAQLSHTDNQIIIDHTGQRVWIKKTETTFPDYKAVLAIELDHIGAVSANKLREIANTAASLYDEWACTKMEFTPTGIAISQQAKTSNFNTTFPGVFSPLKFAIRADWLAKALGQFEGEVEIWGKSDTAPLLVKAGHLKTLISGMRWQE